MTCDLRLATTRHYGYSYASGTTGGVLDKSFSECVAEPRLHAFGWRASGAHPII
jgi:hypothetical protein